MMLKMKEIIVIQKEDYFLGKEIHPLPKKKNHFVGIIY